MNAKALHKLGYGMYVVASKQGDRLNAQIANSVFQITSEPPTVAVSINKRNLTHRFIQESGVFAAAVLCQDTPVSFVGHFGFKSGWDTNKLEGVDYRIGKTGAPLVTENAVAYLEAEVIKEVDVGSHTIFIGSLVDADVISDEVVLKMAKYECTVCGYIFDPVLGDPDGDIAPGTPFEELPDDWVCPVCGADKSEFEKIED